MPKAGLARRFTAAWVMVTAVGCQDSPNVSAPDPAVTPLSVVYVCGNDFDLQSLHSATLTARYAVAGTPEEGELVLPARSGKSTPSSTRLTTKHRGELQVSYGRPEHASAANAGTACPPSSSVQEPQVTAGEWAAPIPWPVVAVHLHLLPSGQLLSWGRGQFGQPYLWDPVTGGFSAVPSTTDLFCSGHAFMADGRLLVTGGHIDEDHGLPDANIFDPATRQWITVEPMRRGRWYPTSTTLPDGEVLTLAGADEAGETVDIPEVWTGTGWRALTDARANLPYYPRAFVAPNGLVFYAGEGPQTSYIDPRGTGDWKSVAVSGYGRRGYGSAVMYQPGRVLIAGGSKVTLEFPTATAEVIDLNDATPSWRYTQPMNHARRQFNATLLPDGSVLATGGTSAAGFTDPAGAVRAAEVWDPATEVWTLLASNSVTRVYHSTSLLLPDGRVIHAGSGDSRGLPRELNAEIFSPPYLFRGPRPSIDNAPDAVVYGQEFFVATREAPRIVRATLVRLGSVTHGFDQNQRFLELSLRRAAGGLVLTAPVSANMAPPGHYLLFILDGKGVPSVARTLRIG
jgi:hypothetical protein